VERVGDAGQRLLQAVAPEHVGPPVEVAAVEVVVAVEHVVDLPVRQPAVHQPAVAGAVLLEPPPTVHIGRRVVGEPALAAHQDGEVVVAQHAGRGDVVRPVGGERRQRHARAEERLVEALAVGVVRVERQLRRAELGQLPELLVGERGGRVRGDRGAHPVPR
jgi:hypothetical protein